MDWAKSMQRAIDYIEENLAGELHAEEAARLAYTSAFEFRRMFACVCGCTLGEYVRARRLTLAGGELARSEAKVIDTALKYGYDSPESFARAFLKFHGIAPSQAKKDGAKLKSFSRLSVKVILQGGSIMDYHMQTRPAFRVAEKSTRVSVEDEENKNTIPEFWTRCQKDGTIERLRAFSGGGRIYGICYGNIPAGEKEFTYSVAAEYTGSEAPEGFFVREIPAATWAVFPCKGAMPQAIQRLWHRIYTEFFPASDYRPVCGIDLEVYTDGDMSLPDYESEIRVAVEKR